MEPKDPSKKHFYISIVKSGIRIGAAVSLMLNSIVLAGALLLLAELFGIWEEM